MADGQRRRNGTWVKGREGGHQRGSETEREEDKHGNTIRNSFFCYHNHTPPPRAAAHQASPKVFIYFYHAVVGRFGSVLEYRLGAFLLGLGLGLGWADRLVGQRQAGIIKIFVFSTYTEAVSLFHVDVLCVCMCLMMCTYSSGSYSPLSLVSRVQLAHNDR